MAPLAAIFFAVLGLILLVVVAVYVLVPLAKGIGWIVKHVFAFIGGMIGSFLRVIGGVITAIVFLPLILVNIIIGRWSAAAHFGRGLQDEFRAIGANAYRFCIGHPARFLLLSPLVEGLERRVPQAVAHAPTSDKPSKRAGQFEGYEIVGSLKGGGSGGRLYIARPDEKKRAQFVRRGFDADTVVIKTFSLADGSSLPQIVRESRALDAAKKLGLVLEHELTDKRFYYVMKYVPGDTLSVVTHRLHEKAGPQGLRTVELHDALAYACDITAALDQYHRGGLWHKDVKPDNIIVHDGRAHLVDFGLVTPLRSAMTLTTHGTEYFRDPEMVRLALKGVKVHEVNGAKFDIFGAGAVLYSVLENSFPAHGVLSQVSKKCPDALKWIVRRAMADYDNRYDTAGQMLADLQFVRGANDPFSVRVADLPSMRNGAGADYVEPVVEEEIHTPFARPASYTPRPEPVGEVRAGSPVPPPNASARPSARPNIVVTNWWRGGFRVERGDSAPANTPFERAARKAEEFLGANKRSARAKVAAGVNRRGANPTGRTAQEQLSRARARAQAAQQRAHKRMNSHRSASAYGAQINTGVGVAVLIFLGGCVFLSGIILTTAMSKKPGRVAVSSNDAGVQVEVASAEGETYTMNEEQIARAVHKVVSDAKWEWSGDISKMKAQALAIAEQFKAAAIEASQEAAIEARDIQVDRPVSIAPGSRIVVSAGDERPARHPDDDATPVNPALLFAGSWVVLDDAPVKGPARERAAGILATMREVGVPLVTSESAAESESDLDLLASARAAAGATTPDDPESSQRLLRWLSEREGDPIGVIRLSRGDREDAILSVVITNARGLGDAMRDAIELAARDDLAGFPFAPDAPTPAQAPQPPRAKGR